MRSALLLVLALPLLAGCAAAEAPVASAAPSPSPSPSSSAAVPEIGTRDASIGSVQAGATVAPVRLSIPQLNIDMRVDAMGLDGDGAMALPDNASDAGWYKFGPGVANEAGATVIDVMPGAGYYSELLGRGVGPKGKVLAIGTHRELLASSPEYVQIFSSQQSTEDYEVQA